MRVLLLCTDAFGGHGGIALFNRELTSALSAHPRIEQTVVVPRLIRGELQAIPPRVTFLPDAARGNASYARTILRLMRQHFDLVICGHVNLLPVAGAIANDPLLITHGIDAWKPIASPFARRVLPRCRGVVAVSQLTIDRFLDWSHFAGRKFVLPNAIRAGQYGIRPRSDVLLDRWSLRGKRVLLTVGRVVAEERYKGFDEVIDVLPELPEDVVYLVAGGGNDLPRLRRKAPPGRVVFTGFFDESEKADLYNLADVYVMPSRGEGFGFVFLEALASGVPAIGSRFDGGREALLGGELGLLVDPSSPPEIRAAILELLARAERRIPERLEFFSYPNFEKRVHAIIDALA
ncbi:MAG TPA: glycosyltransferase [Thermoanaerobaculia bacterium]|jgi:glycosyltransferase involved in cell wall biosynthesis|nr:glycosyltransferase [Thermoanaerobaculia bacterium]